MIRLGCFALVSSSLEFLSVMFLLAVIATALCSLVLPCTVFGRF